MRKLRRFMGDPAICLVLVSHYSSCIFLILIRLYGYNPFKCQDKKTTIKKNGDAYFEIPNSMYPKQCTYHLLFSGKSNPGND